jgi:hypothetical protein
MVLFKQVQNTDGLMVIRSLRCSSKFSCCEIMFFARGNGIRTLCFERRIARMSVRLRS